MNTILHQYFFLKVPLISFDSSGIIIDTNDAFLNFLNVGRDAILNKGVEALLSFSKDVKSAKRALVKARKSLAENKKWEGCINISKVAEEYVNIVAIATENERGEIEKYSIMFHKELKIERFSTSTVDDIKVGLANKDFLLYFQPIMCNQTGKIKKYEALLRMNIHGKILPPYYFLNKMKKMDSYSLLTAYVIEEAVFYISIYHICISINLSLSDLEKHHSMLLKIFNEKPLVPHYLTIEILEDELSSSDYDLNKIAGFLKNIKSKGVSLAIDDFGVRHSNLNRFLEFEPDILKLDGTLIKNIPSNKYMIDIIISLVDFAKKHNIETVAEFVENEDILRIVKEIGIDYSQGYHIGKPLPATEAFGDNPLFLTRKRELN